MARRKTTPTTQTQAPAQAQAEGAMTAPETPKKMPQLAAPMYKALVSLHALGNPHAIRYEEAICAETDPMDYYHWVTFCDDLRAVAISYGVVCADKDATEEDINKAHGKVCAMWRKALRQGEEDMFHKNMFIRPQDADTLRVYATGIRWVSLEGVGSVMTYTPRDDFRRLVELLIGCRMAANKMLDDADRELVLTYQSHEKAARSAKERLEGKGDRKGLRAQLTDANKKLANAEALLVGVVGEEAAAKAIETNPAFKALRFNITELEKAISEATKSSHDNEQWCQDNKRYYTAIIETLDSIESPAQK